MSNINNILSGLFQTDKKLNEKFETLFGSSQEQLDDLFNEINSFLSAIPFITVNGAGNTSINQKYSLTSGDKSSLPTISNPSNILIFTGDSYPEYTIKITNDGTGWANADILLNEESQLFVTLETTDINGLLAGQWYNSNTGSIENVHVIYSSGV
jgi:hypothetical protein